MIRRTITLLLLATTYSASGWNPNWPTGYMGSAIAVLVYTNGSGNTLSDDSTNHANVTLASSQWSSRPGAGGALAFPLSRGTFASNAAFNCNQITICTWALISNATPNIDRLFETKWNTSYLLGSYPDGTSVMFISYSTGVGTCRTNLTVKSRWYHVAYSHDGTNDFMYLDGACIATSANAAVFSAPAKPLRLGQSDDGTSYRLSGMMSDTLITSPHLSPARIYEHMTETWTNSAVSVPAPNSLASEALAGFFNTLPHCEAT